MSIDEKLELLEKVLHEPGNSLQEDTLLSSINGWESLNIVNLQMELAVLGINVEFMELMGCCTVKDVCELMEKR